jgi:hypothetical protein
MEPDTLRRKASRSAIGTQNSTPASSTKGPDLDLRARVQHLLGTRGQEAKQPIVAWNDIRIVALIADKLIVFVFATNVAKRKMLISPAQAESNRVSKKIVDLQDEQSARICMGSYIR